MTRQVDASDWPLVVLKPQQFGNESSFRALHDGLGALLERGGRFCMLADFSKKTYMELFEVKHLSELFRSQGERLDACVVVLAMVIPSAMVRGAIKLVFQPRPPSYPYSVFRTRREAKRSLDPQLAELRMDMSTSMSASMSAAVGH